MQQNSQYEWFDTSSNQTNEINANDVQLQWQLLATVLNTIPIRTQLPLHSAFSIIHRFQL